MLTQVDITNLGGETLSLPVTDSSAGYVVKDIEGLDPVKATLTSVSYAQIDGARPQSSRRDVRNITMKLGFAPNYSSSTVKSLRDQLYRYLMPKSVVTLTFWFDAAIVASILVSVESFSNVRFTNDPEVDFSFIAYDPDFFAPAITSIDGATVDSPITQTITYSGNTDVGVVLEVTLNADMPDGFVIYNTRPDLVIQVFTVTASLLNGDIVTVSTVPGSKSINLNRSGLVSSLLYAVDPPSDWILLQEGDNDFRVFSSAAGAAWTLTYLAKYGAL